MKRGRLIASLCIGVFYMYIFHQVLLKTSTVGQLLVYPHRTMFLLGVVFNVVAIFIGYGWPAVTAGIMYVISGVLGIAMGPVMVFPAICAIICFTASKKYEQPQELLHDMNDASNVTDGGETDSKQDEIDQQDHAQIPSNVLIKSSMSIPAKIGIIIGGIALLAIIGISIEKNDTNSKVRNNQIGINVSQSAQTTVTPKQTKAPYADEIQFQDLKWGMSMDEVNTLHPDYKLSSWLSGDYMKTYCIEEIVFDHSDISFDYSDINVFDHSDNRVIDVAGYKTSDVMFFFAYRPINGVITGNKSDTALYAVRYEFEPADITSVSLDLIDKLKKKYGDIALTDKYIDLFSQYQYYVWIGQSNTGVALTTKVATSDIGSDLIWITYFNYDGNTWLRTASDTIKKGLLDKEHEAQESGDISGL